MELKTRLNFFCDDKLDAFAFNIIYSNISFTPRCDLKQILTHHPFINFNECLSLDFDQHRKYVFERLSEMLALLTWLPYSGKYEMFNPKNTHIKIKLHIHEVNFDLGTSQIFKHINYSWLCPKNDIFPDLWRPFSRGTGRARSLSWACDEKVLGLSWQFFLGPRLPTHSSIDGPIWCKAKFYLELRRPEDALSFHTMFSARICRTRGTSTYTGTRCDDI